MTSIIRLTTPTINYGFRVVNVADITWACLTIKQNGNVVIEKDLSEAEVGETSLSWKLSQADTKELSSGKASAMLNWKVTDGTRGASGKTIIEVEDNEKNEVI